MICHPIDLDETSPNALLAARSARSFASHRRLDRFRALCSPAAVLSAAVMVLGCWAVLTLTGVGPQSWQGRLCRDGAVQPRACPVPVAAPRPASLPGVAS